LQHLNQINIRILNNNDEIELIKIAANDIKFIQLSEQKLQSLSYTSYHRNTSQKIVSGKPEEGYMATVLAHEIYQSPTISLYDFQNELILKRTTEKFGTSTSSPAFSFGFKKKLGQYFSDCPTCKKKSNLEAIKTTSTV